MTIDERGAIRGIWCPVMTPLDADLQPERRGFGDHVRRVLRQGCDGVVIFGTTGEATSFSVEERVALLEAVLEDDIDRRRIVVGTGCCALSDSVRLTRHALDHGVAGVLMLPPFYFKGVSDAALANSFEEIFQRVGHDDFRLYLYHFPSLSGVPVTAGLIERLAARFGPRLAGVKDSSGDWQNTSMLLERFPDLAIFPGSESLLLPALEAGAAGCISASCNVNGAMIKALDTAFAHGAEGLAAQQERVTAVRLLLQQQPLVPGMKALLAQALDAPGWLRVRPPLLPLAAAEAQALGAGLAALDVALAA